MENSRFRFRVWDNERNKYHNTDDVIDNNGILGCTAWTVGFVRYKDGLCVIEQCTGLKDKNGNLIYEGDILEVKVFDKKNYNQKKQTYWTVEWHEHRNNHGFMVYGINRRWNAPVAINKLFNAEAVVVGNIHENADLLGKDR